MSIVSKYFIQRKSDMDESLSDFQESKKILKVKKQTIPKVPSRKNKPRITKSKNQGDIRRALTKKHDLISYTEEFDTVCKQSGLDVDSEQLQIAIALSKSVQNSGNNETASEPLTSQERTKQIRRTLLEYGFKVPEIKNNFNINKKTRKFKRYSKLLTITNEQRRQTISLKYAQVLFESININSMVYTGEFPDNEHSEIYNKATHFNYELLKNNSVFIVDKLFEEQPNTVGNSFKDWSKIPGRPKSPQIEIKNIPFTDVFSTQSELDLLLSGTFASINEIIKGKDIILRDRMYYFESNLEAVNVANDSNKNNENTVLNAEKDNIMDNVILPVPLVNQRSHSPDIFEDESLSLIENTPIKYTGNIIKNVINNIDIENAYKDHKIVDLTDRPCSQNEYSNVTRRNSDDIMDFTKCVNRTLVNNTNIVNSTLTRLETSNNSNCTKMKSNDCMEITECAVTSQKVNIYNIDLTQDSDNNTEDLTIIYEEATSQNLTKFNHDLQDSTLPYVEIDGKKFDTSCNNHLDVNIERKTITDENVIQENIDLTQESRSNSPIESLKEKSSIDKGFDEFEYNHSDHNSSKDIENDISNDLDKEAIKYFKNNSNDSSTEVCNIDISTKSLTNCHRNKSDISTVYEITKDNLSFHNNATTNKETSLNSKPSSSACSDIIFEISDDEFDYSIHKSIYYKDKSNNDESESPDDILNLSKMCDVDNNNSERIVPLNKSISDSYLPLVEIKGTKTHSKASCKEKTSKSLNATPIKVTTEPVIVETPKNRDYLIKTAQVTPMLDYDNLSTPDRNKELDKYGLKPFKRKRAVQILKHLYNQTHPVIEECSETCSPSKKPKSVRNPSPKTESEKNSDINTHVLGNNDKHVLYEVTNAPVIIRQIDCDPEDWIFQKRIKAKVHTCNVPLHVAFHNYVSSRRALREAILRYEPINIDVVHKDLAGYGHKYDAKDLLKFLDKKCITVKTTDNNARNRKR